MKTEKKIKAVSLEEVLVAYKIGKITLEEAVYIIKKIAK